MSDVSTIAKTFPKERWETARPADVGMDPEKVGQAERWFTDALGEGKGRLAIVRSGRVVLETYHHMSETEKPGIASAAKSIYSNVLGIIVAEGGLKSADEKVVEYYPEMMAVREGEGNKPGRYAFEVNRGITFRHLICNVSGYMKPGEAPGQVFNYQSWGMNVLTHALASIYGLYDVNDPEESPGFKVLIKEKLADKIGASWDYTYSNPLFNDRLQKGAKLDIFGYYAAVHSTALDLARVGWLWCNWGRWEGKQVVPEAWMRETTKVAPDILATARRRNGSTVTASGRMPKAKPGPTCRGKRLLLAALEAITGRLFPAKNSWSSRIRASFMPASEALWPIRIC